MLRKLFQVLAPARDRQANAARASNRPAERLIADCQELMSERGEVSGTRIATKVLSGYQALDAASRDCFFDLLIRSFSPDPEEVGKAGDDYRKDPSPLTLAKLQRVVEPPRQELFRRLNIAPGGTRVLVEMRAHLLREGQSSRTPIAADLEHLLTSWFNRGFLVLQRIDWRTPASVLEKLIAYEAVHQIEGWNDLRRRLAADRRCYAFFHPALPDEPIIFVEAALTRGMSDSVQPLLDPEAAVAGLGTADCALFYSITNCQKGLRGVPFGSFLIKQVVEDLGRELPGIRRFATLSPIPGFRAWLDRNKSTLGLGSFLETLANPEWNRNEQTAAELKPHLLHLCARYLLREKNGKEPLDPVARFHLRNGARLERINWLSDTTATGLERSAGLTVNYVYRLSDLERNHELYTRESKISASSEVEALAAKPPRVADLKLA
ncbi:MAG TPA: malonyl-CoA decarboxylase [Bryobacteraceae bacterium]|jgi:malonyl-CoA decarboxylase